MLEKKCGTCDHTKPLSEFFHVCSKKGTYRKECKECTRKKRREKASLVYDYVYDYLSKNPCVKCGYSDIFGLEFDHIDATTKSMKLADMAKYPLPKVVDEIKKCQVLCSPCHRKKTAIEGGFYIVEYMEKRGTPLKF